MKASVKQNEKYVTEKTFEKSMAGIAKSFSRVDEKLDSHDRNFTLILDELKAIRDDNKYFKQTMSGLARESVMYDRQIGNLQERVEKLEVAVA